MGANCDCAAGIPIVVCRLSFNRVSSRPVRRHAIKRSAIQDLLYYFAIFDRSKYVLDNAARPPAGLCSKQLFLR